MKNELSSIAKRALQLSATMSHGNAVHAAISEARFFDSSVEADASVISAELTNWMIAPSAPCAIAKDVFPIAKSGTYDRELQAQKAREANARRRAEREARASK
jgi:hypothetical protein